jgi:transcriptional regulator with XRE-family HTH domain
MEVASRVNAGGFMSRESTCFAERLRHLREKAGLSQYALARQAGLSKQAVSNLEAGNREPTWQTVQLLALALGVDCGAFVDPAVRLPDTSPVLPRGRPRKSDPNGLPTAKKSRMKKK